MSVLDVKKYPDNVLKGKSPAADPADPDLRRLIDDMIETMYASAGIGLAAPQIGVKKRVIVVDIGREDQPLIAVVNPEIVLAEGLVESEEGCLSVPEYIAHLKRAERIVVRGFDRNGKPVEIEAEGLLARAFQHEIDHLDGVLIIDRISAIKREFFNKRYLKALRESNVGSGQ